MFELEINGQSVQFNFGMGFTREINKTIVTSVDGLKDVKKNIGLRYAISCLIDGDVEMLVQVLHLANAGCSPRLTRSAFDAYIEDPETNIDNLFDAVLGFLRRANCTKKTVLAIEEALEAEMNQR